MPAWIVPSAAALFEGLKLTLVITVWSIGGSVVIGLILGLAMARPGAIRNVVRGYVELWRGLPVLVTMFFVYFALPTANIYLDSSVSAEIGLILWGSANVAEVARGAIQSIHVSQFEAAAALGFNWLQTMALVIAPQAIRRMIPSTMNTVVSLLQATALAIAIGAVELTGAAHQQIESLTFNTGSSEAIPIWGSVLVIYFLISFPLTHLSRRIEARLI